jgi:hypothetical protein
MGRACGLTYADVAADMEWHDLAGVRVPVASPSALVRTKDTYRPQDVIDVHSCNSFWSGVNGSSPAARGPNVPTGATVASPSARRVFARINTRRWDAPFPI